MLDKLPAIVASGFVLIFIADVIGNHVHFKTRVGNALVTSLIWGVLFVLLDSYYRWNTHEPLVTLEHLVIFAALGVVLAFLSDLLGNMYEFNRPFVNAFVTSIIWAVAFAIIFYAYVTYVLEAA
jgi:hypothetical protein